MSSHTGPSAPEAPRPRLHGLFRVLPLNFLPIPALILLMAIVRLTVNPEVFYDPPWLILIGNTLFVTVISFVVSYVALGNYRATGRIQILFLGCGVLVFGIGGGLAAAVRDMPDGANLNVTIYNTGALAGALLHFAAAFLLLAGMSPEIGSARKSLWATLGYSGAILFMAILTSVSIRGMIPPFFLQGVGPTPLRQGILGAADLLFVLSFVIFLGTYVRKKDAFLYWYSGALALTAISLTGFLIQRTVGSPVGWVSRCSQYAGGVYFLISLRTAARMAQVRGTSLDNVLTTSLSGAEEMFRALAENAPDAILRFDRGLRHIYANPAGLRRYGKPAGAVIGKTIAEADLGEAYTRSWTERIRTVFDTGRAIEVEDSLPDARGNDFHQARCVPELGPDGTVASVLVVSRDLTERKRAEDAVLQAKEEWERTFDSVPDLIIVVDNQHRILRANRSMLLRLGMSSEQCTGMRCYRAVHGSGAPPRFCPHTQTLRDRQSHSAEFREEHLGGDFLVTTTPLTDANGRMIGSVHVARDVTEARQQARTVEAVNRILEEAIRCETAEALGATCLSVAESVTESKFGFIGEIGPDGFLYDLAISDPVWEACSMAKADGRRVPLGRFPVRGICGRVLTDGVSVVTNDPRSHPDSTGTPQGHPPLTAFLGVPLIRGGVTYGMIAVANREGGYRDEDIHALEALAPAVVGAFARKRAEERLRESDRRHRDLSESERAARSEAERANRIKDEFLANLSHELRTPLNAILGWAQILQRTDPDPQTRQGLEVIERNTRAQAQLISDLLDMSRILSGKLRLNVTHTNVGTVVESAVESLVPAAEAKALRITSVIDPFTSTVVGDPDRLRQAVCNLLSNAVKFTQSGGEIQVVVRESESKVEITVSDNGQGISPEFLPHLFERFRQGDSSATRRHGGLGLGLAIVKHVVEGHGGAILAESEGPGRGATFTIRLPIMAVRDKGEEVPSDEIGRALISEAVNLNGIRVVLVDDEPDTREMLERLLTERGASVVAVASGVEALRAVRESRPDVLIGDIGLPEMDGYEMMRQIRALPPDAGGDTPAVALTAFSRPDDRTRALLAGYGWHLSKPVESSELIATLAVVTKRVPR